MTGYDEYDMVRDLRFSREEAVLFKGYTEEEKQQILDARAPGGRGYWGLPEVERKRLQAESDRAEQEVIDHDERVLTDRENADGREMEELERERRRRGDPEPELGGPAPDPWV
ncbi:hypothetical protein [Amycolatopsis sp. NPDC059657]|uniref:hypothetical protein n=1 Tax=Amycolatopsis sp. NPDC059657 TaxID=3346899 RepID=UPI00366D2C6E